VFERLLENGRVEPNNLGRRHVALPLSFMMTFLCVGQTASMLRSRAHRTNPAGAKPSWTFVQ
jgi:hypothetical protein